MACTNINFLCTPYLYSIEIYFLKYAMLCFSLFILRNWITDHNSKCTCIFWEQKFFTTYVSHCFTVVNIPCIGNEGWQPTPDCKRGDLYTRDIIIITRDMTSDYSCYLSVYDYEDPYISCQKISILFSFRSQW